MKNLFQNSIVLIIIIIISQSGGYAQKGFLVGIDAGTTLTKSKFDTKGSSGSDSKFGVGFTSGINAQYNFNNFIGIKTGLYFDTKNPKLEYNYFFTDASGQKHPRTDDLKYKYSYLTIPLIFKAGYGNDSWGLHANLGAAISILTSAKQEASGKEIDFKDYSNSTDFGLLFGASAYKRIAKKLYLNIDIRDNIGLTNISSRSSHTSKLNTIYTTIGISYLLK